MTENQVWKILSSRQILDTPYLKVRCDEVAVPNGPIIPDYYVIENIGWVGIVPFTEEGYFVLNMQYKHGVGCEVLEFPAGVLDDHEGEDPIMTAHRELMEETGYSVEADQMEFLAQMFASPSGAQTQVWWYLARNARKTGSQQVEPTEVIENLLVTPKELLALIHDGSFAVQGQIAAAYMALERLGFITIAF